MTRRPAAGLQRVLDSLEHAVDLGFDPVKVQGVLSLNETCFQPVSRLSASDRLAVLGS